MTARDTSLNISRGVYPNTTYINKFGRNPDCDPAGSTTAVPIGRDIWDGGIAGAAAWVPPTTGRIHGIVSTSAEDGAGSSTGALTLNVYGLNAAFEKASETVTLNGTGSVNTVGLYTMIYRMEVITSGSAGRNLGSIAATAATDGTVTAQVTADVGQTLMAIFQIPANHRGYITTFHADIFKAGAATTRQCDVFLMTMKFGGGWRIRGGGPLDTAAQPVFQRFYNPYKNVEAKEYVKVSANPSAVAQDIGAGFDIILVNESA